MFFFSFLRRNSWTVMNFFSCNAIIVWVCRRRGAAFSPKDDEFVKKNFCYYQVVLLLLLCCSSSRLSNSRYGNWKASVTTKTARPASAAAANWLFFFFPSSFSQMSKRRGVFRFVSRSLIIWNDASLFKQVDPYDETTRLDSETGFFFFLSVGKLWVPIYFHL